MTRESKRFALVALTFSGVILVAACVGPFGGDTNDSEPDTYTVSYDANGADSGTAPDDQTKIEGEDLTLATNSGNLARSGYTIAGWNTVDDGSGTDYAEGATYSEDADLTLYARWTQLPTYSVTYDANEAESGTAPDDQTKIEGVDLTLSTNSGNLARTGYTFEGWNSADDGSGTDYAEGATYSADADLTLYAKWTANTYTVSFDRQGGTGGSASVSATFGQPMPAATAPTKADAEFYGYYTEANGAGTQYYTAEMESTRDWDTTGDTELIAYWMEVGGVGPAGGIVFYDKGSYSDGWRFLEAAPASTEWTEKPWGGRGTEVGTDTAIGTGEANTQAIVAEYGDNEPDENRADYAAKLAADLDHGGYDDWFLPSKDELDQMYQNLYLEGLGGFSSEYYKTSSEVASLAADYIHIQQFENGSDPADLKSSTHMVRAVRAF